MLSLLKSRKEVYKQLFRAIDVPEDLAPITDVDEAGEVDPASVGLDQSAIDTIWEHAQAYYRTGVQPMISLCVRRKGEIVLNRALGYARDNELARVDTPVCVFSAAKAVSAMLIHLLAEQGKLDLLDPVSYYIPAFAAKGKGGISILQLLSHRGGIPNLPEGTGMEVLLDHSAALRVLCEAEPEDHLGRVQSYHAVTSGVIMDELVRVTTGLTIQQYLDRYIRKPMGMRYFRYGLPKRDRAKAAVDKVTGPKISAMDKNLQGIIGVDPNDIGRFTSEPRFYDAIFPSANLFSTAEESSRFYQMLLNHGRWGDKKIFEPLTVHKATHAFGKAEIDKALMAPMRYSAGFMLGGNPIGMYGRHSQYAYGHLGYANIVCWADPQREIAVSLMNNGKLIIGPHLKSFIKLIGAIAANCPAAREMQDDVPVYHKTS
jgi:CubicO group peptidase (beta-lactamase class C family)